VISPERIPYQLRIGKSAAKAVSKLSEQDYARVMDAMLLLCAVGLGDIKALQGYDKGALRLRVGQMRVYLVVTGSLIEVIDVEQRGDAYKTKTRAKLKKRS
jgi:mRNA-degrading endonuclease RelE of RelBE toxin-antitoxin system